MVHVGFALRGVAGFHSFLLNLDLSIKGISDKLLHMYNLLFLSLTLGSAPWLKTYEVCKMKQPLLSQL